MAAFPLPQDDERRMVSRQMNGTNTGSAAASSNSSSEGGPAGHTLWKQGSVGLPSPEESGFPATHPDMCILRVRRHHLLEVSALLLGKLTGAVLGTVQGAGPNLLLWLSQAC